MSAYPPISPYLFCSLSEMQLSSVVLTGVFCRGKEKELAKLQREVSMSNKEKTSCTAKEKRATESMKNLESQVHQMTHQIRCLENANRCGVGFLNHSERGHQLI